MGPLFEQMTQADHDVMRQIAAEVAMEDDAAEVDQVHLRDVGVQAYLDDSSDDDDFSDDDEFPVSLHPRTKHFERVILADDGNVA